MDSLRRLACAAVLVVSLPTSARGQEPRSLDPSVLAIPDGLLQQLLEFEDNRTGDRRELDLLAQAMGHASPAVRRVAIRASGRLGRHELIPSIASYLMDVSAAVRAEAAVALGLAARSLDPAAGVPAPARTTVDAMKRDIGLAVKPLIARLGIESDPAVAGIIGEVLGMLPYAAAADVARAEAVLTEALTRFRAAHAVVGDTAPAAMGAAKGLEALIRLRRTIAGPKPATVKLLRECVRTTLPAVAQSNDGRSEKRGPRRAWTTLREEWAEDARLRLPRYALLALMAAEQLDADTLESAFARPPIRPDDPELRRIAVRAAGSPAAPPAAVDLLEGVLDRARNDDASVVAEALLTYAPWRDERGCGHYLRRVDGTPAAVSLTSIDLLDGHCPSDEVLPILDGLVGRLSTLGEPRAARPPFGERIDHVNAWHQPVHALMAMAKVDPRRAARRLPAFAAHPVWHVRAWAARVATAVNDLPHLESLARDDNDNVATAALIGLRTIRARSAVAFFIEALARDDDAVVLTAARLLQGSGAGATAGPALLDAFDRFTDQRRETSREVRLALLVRFAELGNGEQAERLAPHLKDPDPIVATEVARTLTTLTGESVEAEPQALPGPAAPSLDELRRLSQSTLAVSVKGWRGPIRIALRMLVEEAPLTVAAFATLVRARHYDGLTFHALLPQERIVGGSPHANDLSGSDRFARDELGMRSHRRGTVGLATRGPDAGDLRFFINLADDERLDRAYTIFAVADDPDGLDGLLEGDIIESIQLVER